MNRSRTLVHSIVKRRWLMAFLVLVLALTSIVVFERALAGPPTLKPPFKVVTDEGWSFGLNGPKALSVNDTIIFSQTFNISYTSVSNPSLLGWHELVVSPSNSQYTWAYAGRAPLTDTVWSAARWPSGSPVLDPATDTYTNNMAALLVYGPVNLSAYHHLVLTTTYWLDTKPLDYLNVVYSTDGSTWHQTSSPQSVSDPTLSSVHSPIVTLDDAALAGQPAVWIGFIFTSNNDDQNGRGAFVQDVVVRGKPYSKVYLPLIRRDAPPTPTPTPTATPQPSYHYFYTFTDESPTNNPDFNRWGGDRSTNVSCGTNGANTCTYYQGLAKDLGNPGNALTLWFIGNNGKGGSGPRQNGASLSTAKNFEYSADLYVYQGQKDAIYGLVYNASSGTFPDSGNPPINTDVNYYLYQLHMDTTSSTRVATWQVIKVTNGNRENLKSSSIPITLNTGQWHNIKVRQNGSAMEFYLNGQSLGTATYSNWDDARRRFGLYIDVRNSNSSTTPFEFFADNIAVKDLP